MSTAANPTIGPVRAAWGVLDSLSVTARRVGTALTELLNWPTWTSPEPTVCDNPRRGITRQRIGERANLSVRSVTRGIAELRLSGLLTVRRRTWLQSWYALDALELLARAGDARVTRREARLRKILLGDEPAPVVEALPPPSPGAEALARAAAAQPRRPAWSEHSRRPDDLARLVWVFTAALHGEEQVPDRQHLYAGRMESLAHACKLGELVTVEILAQQLVTVATWLRHDGRALLSKRERTKAQPIPQPVSPYEAIRPRNFREIVPLAEAWVKDERPRDMAALVEALLAEHGAPASDAAAHRLLRVVLDRETLSPREESTVLHALLRRVPARPEEPDEEDEPPAEPEDLAGELDPAWLTRLAEAVPEVEAMAAELATLPALGWDDPIFRRPNIDPERRRASAQKQLRAQLAGELDAWLSRARAFIAAPDSPAMLHDLAEALARLRELSGRLAR